MFHLPCLRHQELEQLLSWWLSWHQKQDYAHDTKVTGTKIIVWPISKTLWVDLPIIFAVWLAKLHFVKTCLWRLNAYFLKWDKPKIKPFGFYKFWENIKSYLLIFAFNLFFKIRYWVLNGFNAFLLVSSEEEKSLLNKATQNQPKTVLWCNFSPTN